MKDEVREPKEVDSPDKASVEQMRLRVKEALAQHGGPEAILHWLRDDEVKRS